MCIVGHDFSLSLSRDIHIASSKSLALYIYHASLYSIQTGWVHICDSYLQKSVYSPVVVLPGQVMHTL